LVDLGDAIQGDLDAIIFNPMAATILKWLGFKVVSWMQDFWPCTAMVCIVGLVWLHHTHYLGDATMATKACNLL
jgi:hypothetical protein